MGSGESLPHAIRCDASYPHSYFHIAALFMVNGERFDEYWAFTWLLAANPPHRTIQCGVVWTFHCLGRKAGFEVCGEGESLTLVFIRPEPWPIIYVTAGCDVKIIGRAMSLLVCMNRKI